MKKISAFAALIGAIFAYCATAARADNSGNVADVSKSEDAPAKEIAKADLLQSGADGLLQKQEPKNDGIQDIENASSDKTAAGTNSQSWQYVPFNPLSGKTFYKESLMFKKGSVSVLLSVLPIKDKSSEQDVAEEIAKRLECQTDSSSAHHIYPDRDEELSKRIASSGAALPQGSFYKISCSGTNESVLNTASDEKENAAVPADISSDDGKSDESSSFANESDENTSGKDQSKSAEKSIPAWDTQIIPADIYIKRGGREFLAIAVSGGDLADAAELMVQQQKDAIVYQQTRDSLVEARNAAADKAIEESRTQIADDGADDELHNPDDLPPDEIFRDSAENGAASADELIESSAKDSLSGDDKKSESMDANNKSKSAGIGKVSEKKHSEE